MVDDVFERFYNLDKVVWDKGIVFVLINGIDFLVLVKYFGFDKVCIRWEMIYGWKYVNL